MTLLRTSLFLACVTVVAAGLCSTARAQQADAGASAAARAVVAGFYEWYGTGTRGVAAALDEKRAAFSEELHLALKADVDAKARANGEIVGLDYDPFLNSQDPCAQYAVGGVTPRSGAYSVDVFAVCDGAREERPSVIVDVRLVKGTWVIADVRDRDGSSLLATLKRSR